ncbi:uncharacterized protein LOC125478245 isoform X2 [Pyrus x bretschneideri]|uniref:uncharacterized protein LOC125478245 isoform X2 n=1 Tax=Pyrus x bretschneideri TaxID=225117 RepID=UPI00203068D8|nr:uncharacterized protein LOC125478245 isoform X2 [Pyrus x bretschneideri]
MEKATVHSHLTKPTPAYFSRFRPRLMQKYLGGVFPQISGNRTVAIRPFFQPPQASFGPQTGVITIGDSNFLTRTDVASQVTVLASELWYR